MAYLFVAVVILYLCWVYISIKYQKLSSTIISLIIISIVFALVISFADSDFMCTRHIKDYEKGIIQKEYTIIGTDTTYKYKYIN